MVTTIGLTMLAGVRLPRWFWLGLQVGTLFGVGFVHWLFGQSVYQIGALCPYCMVVWVVTIPVFWYATLHNLTAGHLPISHALRPLAGWLTRYHGAFLTVWYLILLALVGRAFWDYWSGLLGERKPRPGRYGRSRVLGCGESRRSPTEATPVLAEVVSGTAARPLARVQVPGGSRADSGQPRLR